MTLAAETTPAARPSSRSPAIERWLQPNGLLLVGLWLFAALHFYNVWPTLGVVFRDTDDMMRLAEVRDFLAGQGWFDLHQYRLDPPSEVPMHWSRLIDLPIALLIRLFSLVLDPANATRAAMFVWPAIPFLPVLWASRTLGVRFGGGWAAFPAVYLLATLGLVVAQFVPGRIDHHNVQIMLTMLLLTVLTGPAGVKRGAIAGLIGAAMMTIGMETLPFLILGVVGLAVAWLVGGDETGETKAFGLTLAAATLVAAGATLPPSEWGRGACDALSLSYVGLAVVGGVGLAGAAAWAPAGRVGRGGLLAVVAVAAVAAFAWPEPACLKGPFGEILPEVRSAWLDGVNEVQPWPKVFAEEHVGAILALVTPMFGLIAFGWLARDGAVRRMIGFWVFGAALATALAIGLMQIRTMVYANTLAVPLVAAAIGRIGRDAEVGGRSISVAVLGGSILANCMVLQLALEQVVPASWRSEAALSNAAQGLASPVASQNAETTAAAAAAFGSACYTTTSYEGLAALPTGLVVADINLGPSILLATRHSVVAAPYHRMQRGILDAHHMLHRAPAEALPLMAARGVDYLVFCTSDKSKATAGSLLERLEKGEAVVGLEAVAGPGPVRVYRVHRGPVLTAR